MKGLRSLTAWALVGLLVGAVFPEGSSGQDDGGAQTAGKPQVYLSELSLVNAHNKGDDDFGRFVNQLIGYRFAEVEGIALSKGTGDLNCNGQGAELNAALKRTIPAQQTQRNRPIFQVRGSLEFHAETEQAPTQTEGRGKPADVIINYEVLSSTNCMPKVLVSRSEPLVQDHMLETLTILTDAMVIRLREESNKRTRIDVALPSV